MRLQRITTLTEPPEVGRFYLVPTVFYPWLSGHERAWPVFLPKHEDREHLNYPAHHYHVDPRFLSPRLRKMAHNFGWMDDAEATAQRYLLHYLSDTRDSLPHPPVIWKRLKCWRFNAPYRYGDNPTIVKMRSHYTGRQCAASASSWICPHKRFPLGSVAVDEAGVITCPVHGLRIRAADGVCLA